MADLQQLQSELEKVNAAYLAALGGSEYEIESGHSRRRLKRQNIGEWACIWQPTLFNF